MPEITGPIGDFNETREQLEQLRDQRDNVELSGKVWLGSFKVDGVNLRFADIPQSYRDLEISYVLQGTTANVIGEPKIRFNNRVIGHYWSHSVVQIGTAARFEYFANNDSGIPIGAMSGTPRTDDTQVGKGVIRIPAYRDPLEWRSIFIDNADVDGVSGYFTSTHGIVDLAGAPLVDLLIYAVSGSFTVKSHVDLYGIR